MAISIISDLHIKSNSDETYKKLLVFLDSEIHQNITDYYLLGDIFDLVVGPHNEYYALYPEFFEAVAKLIEQGRKIHFFEGNHDLHLKKLFNNYLESRGHSTLLMNVYDSPEVHQHWDFIIYFTHGDELDYDNHAYLKYRKFISSPFCSFLAHYIVPYRLLDYLGKKASENSTARKTVEFDFNNAQKKYRRGAEKIASAHFDYIVAGHTHVDDEYVFDYKGKAITYLNNGLPQKTGKFLYFDKSGYKFLDF